METIGLIAAMPSESAALLRLVKGWERTAFGSFRGARFRLMERECQLLTSGMGLKRAAAATRLLVAGAHPSLLISFGIAGAVHADLRIGDVVVAGNSCRLKNGLPGQLLPLSGLSEAAWNAAAQAIQPENARLVVGTAVTTRGSQVVLQEIREMPNPVLEMETAGIAQVAAGMGIPLVSIRSVSDGPDAPIPFDLGVVMDDNDNLRIGRILATILRQPRLIFQARQMSKNSRKAEDLAARALVAALGQSPLLEA